MAGTYFDVLSNDCLPCHKNCPLCNGPLDSHCIPCGKYAIFIDNKCTCPSFGYYDQDKQICLQCNSNYKTCSNREPTSCTSCYDVSFLEGDKCLKCTEPNNTTNPNCGNVLRLLPFEENYLDD